LVLAPLVLALHAAVLFSAWQVVDRKPAQPQATAREADSAVVVVQAVVPAPVQMLVQSLVQTPAQAPAAAGADAPIPVSSFVTSAATITATPTATDPGRAPTPAPEAGPAPALQGPVAPSADPDGAAAPSQATGQRLPTAAAATPTPPPAPPSPSAPASPMPEALAAAAAPAALTPAATLGTPVAPAASSREAVPTAPALAESALSLTDDPTPQSQLPPPAADARAPTARAPSPPPAAATTNASTSPPSLPIYRGEPPPPATLHFTLRRATISGRGQLSWKHSAQGYELTLQGTVLGLRALEQTSRGHFDQGSLAPDRFLDSRRGRAARAANFRRDVGLISYSAGEQTYPLVRGAQDRLSWMLHLPAVMQANPALRQVGAELHMFVTGARGDGDVWGFRVISVDRLSLPVGDVPRALHLQRLPRYERDTQADIWLDPEQHHLPARVRLQSGEDVLDLVLERREGG
jgi:hypothetical protein